MSDVDVTIILATFNPGALLEPCLDSIASQVGCSVDVVLVDGGSSDGTTEVLERRSSELAYWHSRPDDGIYDAWNQGLPHARGRWIAFIGADDLFAGPDSVARLLAEADRANAADGSRIVYGRNIVLAEDGTHRDVQGEPWDAIRERFQREMVMPHPGTLHHRTVFDDHGSFDTSFRIAGDHELLLRELRTGPAHFADGVTVCLVGGAGVSRTWRHASASMRESRRARRQNGIPIKRSEEVSIWLRHWISVIIDRVLGDRGSMAVKRMVRRALGRDRGAADVGTPHAVRDQDLRE